MAVRVSRWLVLLRTLWHSHAIQRTNDLFLSSYEEYDPWVFDPNHGFGSPFGGFSRSTPSRLAKLPLFLPNTDAQDPNPTPLHTEIRDAFGRLYVCRVYHEDELEPASLEEGMFEVPKLKKVKASPPPQVAPSAASETAGAESETKSLKSENEKDGVVHETDTPSLIDAPPSDSPTAQRLKAKSEKELVDEMDKLLEPLEGLCAQTHKGWWSYEWCYKDSVTQFHVEISKATSTIEVQDITSLGDYDSRKVDIVDDVEYSEKTIIGESEGNTLAQGRTEIARVRDYYRNGTPCPGTDKERESVVNLVCCSEAMLERRKGLVHRDNIHVTSNVMSIYEVEESKINLCTYNVTVCTPLLCDDHSHEEEEDTAKYAATGAKLKDKHAKLVSPTKENESILEILERTLGGFCLQTSTGGWWTYELCHKKSIRQYHEVVGSKKNKNGHVYTARSVEADHNLGNYRMNVYAAIVPEDEYKFVVNATDQKKGNKGKKVYFELEYIGGDVCDHSDVTDAAIVAGTSGTAKKGIERASSVRYRCGEMYDITVSEDSTCHYIVWVDLPDLCKHPLFIEPVSKRQVFKCLHVPEGMELELAAPTASDQAMNIVL